MNVNNFFIFFLFLSFASLSTYLLSHSSTTHILFNLLHRTTHLFFSNLLHRVLLVLGLAGFLLGLDAPRRRCSVYFAQTSTWACLHIAIGWPLLEPCHPVYSTPIAAQARLRAAVTARPLPEPHRHYPTSTAPLPDLSLSHTDS